MRVALSRAGSGGRDGHRWWIGSVTDRLPAAWSSRSAAFPPGPVSESSGPPEEASRGVGPLLWSVPARVAPRRSGLRIAASLA